MTFAPPPVAQVEWIDAYADKEWHSLKKAAAKVTPKVSVSVGFLLQEDATGVVLAQTANSLRMVGDCIAIPAGMVRKVTILNEPKARPAKARR